MKMNLTTLLEPFHHSMWTSPVRKNKERINDHIFSQEIFYNFDWKLKINTKFEQKKFYNWKNGYNKIYQKKTINHLTSWVLQPAPLEHFRKYWSCNLQVRSSIIWYLTDERQTSCHFSRPLPRKANKCL